MSQAAVHTAAVVRTIPQHRLAQVIASQEPVLRFGRVNLWYSTRGGLVAAIEQHVGQVDDYLTIGDVVELRAQLDDLLVQVSERMGCVR